MPGKQLSEQEKKEYDAILNEWMGKIDEIPSYEERKGGNCLDNGYNGIYTELERIYRPKLDKILGRDGQVEKETQSTSKIKKFSDMIVRNTNGFPELPKTK
ncbi:hypothetical protein D7X98_04170 [bacterium 1XD8-76]|nr:hypothetical protein D7X98_04170 [bacterium 1XD8-76]